MLRQWNSQYRKYAVTQAATVDCIKQEHKDKSNKIYDFRVDCGVTEGSSKEENIQVNVFK